MIKQILPTFSDVFGSDYEDVLIHIKSIGEPPVITISEEGEKLIGNATMKIMNPLNRKFKSAVINATYEAVLNLAMNSDFKISGSIEKISMNVTGFRAFFKTEEILKTLEKNLNI